MEHINEIVSFIVLNKVLFATAGVAVLSEAMALFPGCKSNGILHLTLAVLKSVSGKKGVAAVLLVSLMLAGGGCSTIRHATNPETPEYILTAQDTAHSVVLGFEAAFQATPAIVDALLKNGTITPHTYNAQILPAYNRGLASLNVVIASLKAAQTARQDPNQSEAYTVALAQFLTDKSAIDNMLAAFGKGGAK